MDDNENVVEAKSNLPFFPNLTFHVTSALLFLTWARSSRFSVSSLINSSCVLTSTAIISVTRSWTMNLLRPVDLKTTKIWADCVRLCKESRALQDASRQTVAQSKVIVQQSKKLVLLLKTKRWTSTPNYGDIS